MKTLRSTDVLVVGGGSAGFAAALAAARMGVDVTLVEKDGSLGGLWTNGLVLREYGTNAFDGEECVNYYGGIGMELNKRLEETGHLLKHRENDFEPTPDPEAVIHYMDEMLVENNVTIVFRAYATGVSTEGKTINSVQFASKQGSFTIKSKIVIDTTGDGDIFSEAGASYQMFDKIIGLNHLLTGIRNADKTELRKLTNFEPTPNEDVAWVNMAGEKCDFADIIAMSRLEIKHRKKIWDTARLIAQNEKCKDVYIARCASQLGIRMTRSLKGAYTLTIDEATSGKMFHDNIAVSGWSHYSKEFKKCGKWGIPYRILFCRELSNLLTAGRSVSCDYDTMDELRLIPNCIRTGQAAGVAAAIAVNDGCGVEDVNVNKLRESLVKQNVIID